MNLLSVDRNVKPIDLLIFCTADHGGLSDYAHAQASALAKQGFDVVLLAPATSLFHSSRYDIWFLPSVHLPIALPRIVKQLATAVRIFVHQQSLNRTIARSGCRHVLFTTYSEYLAPLWAWRLRGWRSRGVRFAAVVHDPVRNYVVGPPWWHRLSIAQGYSFLDVAFVHAPIELDIGQPQTGLRTEVIPHGPFRYPMSEAAPTDLRAKLRVPRSATLLLSFGHIRDNKNLQLMLQAMAHLPQVWLLVAGPEATAGQRPSTHYRQLAQELGVHDRCLWQVGYQSGAEVADAFTAVDAVLITYASSFRSASGVMHLAAHYRKPVVASAGASALLHTVQRFSLGVVVPPDDASALAEGLKQLISAPPSPQWQAYEQANSWDRNAQLVSQALGLDSLAEPVNA
jgi:glycosyltransferase involved in cell wall biosynthesis